MDSGFHHHLFTSALDGVIGLGQDLVSPHSMMHPDGQLHYPATGGLNVTNGTVAGHLHHVDPFIIWKELSISIICIFGGAAVFLTCEKVKTVGVFMVFFGAQTFMNMYMKAVFSSSVVTETPPKEYCPQNYDPSLLVDGVEECTPWIGFQAGFFVTAMQQFFSFFIFWIVYGTLKGLGLIKYELKQLKDGKEWFVVICFALSFTMNIALNNFSLSLMPLTLNLIIRSCLPLSTFGAQWLSTKLSTGEGKPIKPVEIALMTLGVILAGVVVWAKISAANEAKGSQGGDKESGALMLGIIICIVSLFSGSVNLALAGVLGQSVKLDSAATVVYNSIPATLFLLPLIFFYPHPIHKWDGFGTDGVAKDIDVAMKVWELSKPTFSMAAGSSVCALVYNILQFGIVQYLTATHVAFAGNFNKAATIPLALLVGIDHLPQGKWGVIYCLAAAGNIGAFFAYNMVTGGAGGHGGGGGSKEKEKEKEPMNKEIEDDEDEDEDSESEEEGCCA